MSTPPPPSPKAPYAALFSSVLPGAGQVYVGRPKSAYVFFVVDFVLVASLVLIATRFQSEALEAFLTPDRLMMIMVFNILLLVYRGLAMAGAYRGATDFTPSAAGGIVMVVAVLLLVVPHLVFGYFAWTSYDLIKTVFAPSQPVASDTTTATTTPGPTTTGVPGDTTTVPSTTTTTLPPRLWDGLERLNIALLGSDMRPNQETLDPGASGYVGHRTDSMTVISINPNPPYDVAMLSVPRFLSNYPMPDGYGVPKALDEWDWIGHVYRLAEDIHPTRYPGPGTPGENAVKTALGELFGIQIHYYALITVRGFQDVIDALGGVTIDVPKRIVDRNYDTANNHFGSTRTTVVIDAGKQHLDGFRALAYARIRSQSHEFARMQRQRCIMGALVDQTSPLDLLFNFGSIADAIKENVQTDIPQDKLADFVSLLPNLKTENFSTLNIDRSAYEISAPNRLIRYFDIDQIRADAQFIMRDPQGARAALGLGGLNATCEETLD